jgi:hypothetical protein
MKRKKTGLLTACLLIGLSACASPKYNAGSYVYIDITNPSEKSRADVPITLRMDSIVPLLRHYTNQRIGIFDGSRILPTQFDDMNRDGKADEIAFLIDLKGHETKRLMARIVPPSEKIKNYEKEVYADLRHRKKLEDGREETRPDTAISSDKDDMYNKVWLHGILFESGPIAYRAYFNDKQTIDIYGKYENRLELPITQWHTTAKQLAEGYGDDVLLVGNSVGVGTFKGWDGTKALHTTKYGRRTQRLVATGDLRNTVEIELKDWEMQEHRFDARIRFTQYARHRDVKVEVFLSPTSDGLTFCSGVQTFPEEYRVTPVEDNLVGCWGKGFPQKDTVKYSHKETVGLGLAVPSSYSKGRCDDPLNRLILMSPKENKIEYWFTACSIKEKKGYTSATEWFSYLNEWKEEVLHPVRISYRIK